VSASSLRRLDILSLIALLVYLGWGLGSEWVREGALSDQVWDDYAILRDLSRRVIESGGYAWQFEGTGRVVVFVHSPSSCLFHTVLARLGDGGGLIWMGLIAASAAGGVSALLLLLDWRGRPGRYVAVVLAVVACHYFVRFDLHFLNSNIVFTALAVAGLALALRGRESALCAAMAGLCLALSIATKPYALLLIPYLALLRQSAALVWACFWLGAILFALPALALGVDDSLTLQQSWLQALYRASGSDFAPRILSFDVSLLGALRDLRETGALPRGVSDAALVSTARGLQLAWLGLVAAALAPRLRLALAGPAAERESGRSVALEGGILLLAPLPLSALLQPHHGVALFPLALLLATRALEAGAGARERLGLALLAVACFAAPAYAPTPGARGMAIFACLLAVVVTARWTPLAARRGQATVAPPQSS
jgi:hypothetical protein